MSMNSMRFENDLTFGVTLELEIHILPLGAQESCGW